MDDRSESFDELLLDLHLNRLGTDRAERVEQEVANSPELAVRSRALRDLLRLLDADSPPPPPADLPDRVLAYIERHERVIPMPRPAEAAVGGQSAGHGWTLGWWDLAAAAACLILFFSLAVPGYHRAKSVSQRSRCLNQLSAISGAMTAYGQANNGYLPHAGYIAEASWLPTNRPDVPYASNTRHVFPLVQQGYLPSPRVFICPADPNGRPMSPEDIRRLSDFAQRVNNSYSFIFMNRPQGIRLEELQNGLRQQMVLGADRNPLLPGIAGPVTEPVQAAAANSPLHDHGAGQNAVYADGHGGWFTIPTIGIDQDDIYRVGQLDRYQGTEIPLSQTDAFLPP